MDKYIRKYSNECGKYLAIILLNLYELSDNIISNYENNGTSISNMEKCIDRYFKKVLNSSNNPI